MSAPADGVKCVVFVSRFAAAGRELRRYGTVVGEYPFLSAYGAVIDRDAYPHLCGLSCVRAVAGHSNVTLPPSQPSGALPESGTIAQALTALHAQKIDGRGVTCAVIDTGIRPHLDFCMPFARLGFVDVIGGKTTPYDDNGHGTAVAGILGGNGLVSGGKYRGAAPRARVIALKAVDAQGAGSAFHILTAMQWVYANCDKYGIRVLNLSLGSEPLAHNDPLRLGAEALWRRGITVVASAGNAGPDGRSIKSPGISPRIITVGGAAQTPQGWYAADFSSRGPAGNHSKPDLLSPAVDVHTVGLREDYTVLSGTSMAAPLVTGVCALILQKQPRYTPDRIKEVLLRGAQPLPCGEDVCGRGLLRLSFFDDL